VNAVSPGYTRTDRTRGALERDQEKILSRIPARRVTEPEEIARWVAYLASEGAEYITGETVNANGGGYMQ
jgi:3-oxoacyl-[acyl-carrier protein] reductase